MNELELYYPCRPFIVTQAWGIYNPAYLQFGFSRHNGVDFIPYNGAKEFDLHCPVKMEILDTGNENGAGNFIKFITTDMWLVDGVACYVGGKFMHLKSQAVKKGQICEVGDLLGVADNTGFSTGPHTHLSVYRLGSDKFTRLDTDKETNYTFDPGPYWNGKFAVDVLIKLLQQLLALLHKLLSIFK